MAAAVSHGPSQLLESGQTAENLKSAKTAAEGSATSRIRYSLRPNGPFALLDSDGLSPNLAQIFIIANSTSISLDKSSQWPGMSVAVCLFDNA